MLGAIIVLARAGQLAADDSPELEDELDVGVGVGVAAVQVGPVIVLALNVTVAADSPTIRPSKVAPLFMAFTPLRANIFPINEVVVSSVTELPTLHHTLQGSPPVTDEPGEVMSVDTVLKM